MNLQKAASWANIGSFFLAVIIWRGQSHNSPSGVGMTPGLFILIGALLLAGFFNFAAAWMNHNSVTDSRGSVSSNAWTSTPKNLVSSNERQKQENIESKVPPVLVLPKAQGRVYVPSDQSPAQLVHLVDGQTTLHANKIVEVYIGKWMAVAGTVSDTRQRRSAVSVTLHDSEEVLIFLYFKPTWLDQVSVLRRGNKLSVIGKISEIDRHGLSLEECEILTA